LEGSDHAVFAAALGITQPAHLEFSMCKLIPAKRYYGNPMPRFAPG
jgi:hypothetical protein